MNLANALGRIRTADLLYSSDCPLSPQSENEAIDLAQIRTERAKVDRNAPASGKRMANGLLAAALCLAACGRTITGPTANPCIHVDTLWQGNGVAMLQTTYYKPPCPGGSK